jgi:hypothetical protein
MRFVTVASVLALALAATALALPVGTKDPSELILAHTDFPAGADYTWGEMPASYTQPLAKAGIDGKGAFFHVSFHGSNSKEQTVDGIVTTTGSAQQAHKLYQYSKTDLQTSGTTRAELPGYGDEQIALTTKLVSKIQLLVRRNRVVWEVETHAPTGALISEIEKYAGKERHRIGAG